MTREEKIELTFGFILGLVLLFSSSLLAGILLCELSVPTMWAFGSAFVTCAVIEGSWVKWVYF